MIQVNENRENEMVIIDFLVKNGYKFRRVQETILENNYIEELLQIVCTYFRVSITDVRSRRRYKEIAVAKLVFSYVASEQFHNVRDKDICRYVNYERSMIPTNRKIVTERLSGKLSHLPENLKLAKDIEIITNNFKQLTQKQPC